MMLGIGWLLQLDLNTPHRMDKKKSLDGSCSLNAVVGIAGPSIAS